MTNQTARAVNGTTYLESYPSLREPEPELFMIAGIFLSCFVVGICGNASTLTQILGFGTPKSAASTRPTSSAYHRFLRVYVVCLISVDSLMLLGLPSAITESLIGFWIFGSYCKFHHLANCVGRIASNLVLTSISVEHYLILVATQSGGSRHTTGLLILLAAVASSVLLLPVLIFANAQRVFLFESRNRGGQVIQIRIFKCVDGMPTNLLFWSTGLNFFVGFFLPYTLIAIFNVLLLIRLRREQREIVFDIVIIAFFRFVSWLPYWVSVLYVSYVDLFESRTIKTLSNGSASTMLFLYCAHILPFIYAAFSWILYGRLANHCIRFPPSAHQRSAFVETTSFTHQLGETHHSSSSMKRPNKENSLIFGTSRVVCPSPSPLPSDPLVDASRLDFQREIETFESF